MRSSLPSLSKGVRTRRWPITSQYAPCLPPNHLPHENTICIRNLPRLNQQEVPRHGPLKLWGLGSTQPPLTVDMYLTARGPCANGVAGSLAGPGVVPARLEAANKLAGNTAQGTYEEQ